MMKTQVWLASLALGLSCLGSSAAADADETHNEVVLGAQYYGITGDEGRFREDRFRKDKAAGGVESLRFESDKYDIDLKALGHDEYRLKTKLRKEDLGYVLIQGQWARRYFDGSNEYFDPTLYNLTGGEAIPDNTTTPPGTVDDGFYSAADFADRADWGLYADRMDATLELGLTRPDLPEAALGWRRWSRKGKEYLLRGERLIGPAGLPRLRTIGALAEIDGVSDLYYLDVSKELAEKHLVRFRHEAEYYRDKQDIAFPRYKQAGGAAVIDQYRTFQDDPKFKSHVSLASVDSQITENTLVSGAYMYGYLKNESSREVIRPDQATFGGRNHSIGTTTKNFRKNHAGTLGIRKARVAGVENLDVIAGLRMERVQEDATTRLFAKGTTPRDSTSDRNELRFVENFEARFRGWEKTSASLKIRLEQRDIDQVEYADLGNHEIFDPAHFNSGIQFLDYKAGIKHRNEEYGLKLVNRSLPVKLEAGLKYKQKDRNYNVTRDADPRFYPGRIGNLAIKRKEAELGASKMFSRSGRAALKYSFRDEDITAGAANNGPTQDWKIHRVSGNLGGAPTDKLFVLATVIYERYQLDTPTNITNPASDWAQGERAYDYTGDYTTGLLDAEYAFTPALKGSADYQVTDTLGLNGYLYQKGGLGFSYKLTKNSTVGLGGEYFSFEDHSGGVLDGGGGFDDYRGYGIKTTYAYKF